MLSRSAPLYARSTRIHAVLELAPCASTLVTVPRKTSDDCPTAWHGGGGGAQLHAHKDCSLQHSNKTQPQRAASRLVGDNISHPRLLGIRHSLQAVVNGQVLPLPLAIRRGGL